MAKWTREYKLQYMREYSRTHRRELTHEEREKQNARQRERYANDAEYKARMQAKAKDWNESHPVEYAERMLAFYQKKAAYWTDMLKALRTETPSADI